MFLNTLCVTLKEVRNIIKTKRLTKAGMCKVDNRSKHNNHMKIDEKDKQVIRNHICFLLLKAIIQDHIQRKNI